MIHAKKEKAVSGKRISLDGALTGRLPKILKRNLIFTSSQNGVAGQRNSGQFAEDVDKKIH